MRVNPLVIDFSMRGNSLVLFPLIPCFLSYLELFSTIVC